MTNAIGCDVSRYQIYFDPAKASGAVDFAIQKITEGLYIHSGLETMWAGVQKVGIRGAYHYQRSGVNWQAQADLFLNTAAKKSFHIYALDLEGYGNTVNSAMLLDTQRIINYWKTKASQRVILYTNINFYNQLKFVVGEVWLNTIPLWIAYPNQTPGKPVLPSGRQTWSVHQYSWTGIPSRWGTGYNTDENVFNGTLAEMQAWAGGTIIPPPVITDGHQQIRRYNSTINIWRGQARVKVTNNGGDLIRPSAFISTGAEVIANGDGWDKLAPHPHKPLSLAVSEKTWVQSVQFEGRPFYNSKTSGVSVISTTDKSDAKNLVSGTRTLAKSGINMFAASTDPEHVTERHPRTAIGYTLDGKQIACVVDGRSTISAGVTLKELANIMLEAGAWYALELDGGDSSYMAVKGVQVSKNGDIINGVKTVRATVNSVLYFTEAGMTNGTAREALGNIASVRNAPDVSGAKVGTLAGGSTVSFMELVNGSKVATDKWLKLPDGISYVNQNVAGKVYFTILTMPSEPPPPVEKKITDIDIQLAAGSVVTMFYSDGSSESKTA